jgi:hypothetical protein
VAYLTLGLDIAQEYLIPRRLAEGRQQALDLIIDDRCRALGVLVEVRTPSALWPRVRAEVAASWFGDRTFLGVMQRYRFDVRLVDSDRLKEPLRVAVPESAG